MKIDKYSAILGNTVGFHDMASLTDQRPVASLPFGGKYRLIDFPLSSLANAGIRSVFGIFQQNNISSVFDHIRSGREWGLSTLLSHYYLGIYNTRVESSTVGKEYYDQLLTYLKRSGSDQTVALNCDVLINIDLNQVFHLHSTTDQPITVVYKKLGKEDISDVNAVLDISETDHVLSHQLFDKDLDQKLYNMSTDIFVVDTDWLIEKLEVEAQKDNPEKLRYVLRDLAAQEGAFAYEYTGYLANIYSVPSYFKANLDMLESQKFYSLFSPNQKIYTKVKNEEPTYYAPSSKVSRSQFASGSLVRGEVEGSVVSRNTNIAEGSKIKHSVLFPRVNIGKDAVVEYAIVDKNVEIGEGVTVRGTAEHPIVLQKGQKVTEDLIL
ncbi:glucose-1-phosphate adenylyltransferase subunit GlgD [Streptococcus oricebi]|uniref:Glucose-1-phosphate adenylyltransferase subunit GlgD n=1 Tax=Streptococcus oricebi TaxID=1547447 RepID=A0ABS5B1C4_9STRE|nr:glucose-1-phosphate adenylyltransferase subunit GlgD [Streptococcus oricebi]MBP2622618.1 glucose-1-phosphate adenylyltransferase subunit GlgD [Streptococcus oricebi]